MCLIPQEMREHIFSFLPPKDLFGLGKVCITFNNELSNTFFQRKCYEIFESLKLFPNLYDPIVKTIKSPWKVIFFILSDWKTNKEFFSVVERTAKIVHSEFKTYLSQCAALTQEDLKKNENEMRDLTLEAKKEELEDLIKKKRQWIQLYNNTIQDPKAVEQSLEEMIYYILFSLHTLKNWGDSVSTLSKILREINEIRDRQPGNTALINNLKNTINSLPNECSTYIWKILYDQCANKTQEWQWSENHFQKYLKELKGIIKNILSAEILLCSSSNLEDLSLNYEDCNKNPCLDVTSFCDDLLEY